MSTKTTCSCVNEDVCPKCFEPTIDEFYRRVVAGTAGKSDIDHAILMKQTVKNMLTRNEQAKLQLDREIMWLQYFRDKQQN